VRLPRYRFVPPSDQETRYRDPFRQVFVLKPRLELGLAAGRDIVEDGKDAGRWIGHIGCP
jgi:hypothetical protein